MAQAEPTILVKRADGTSERVPLSQLHGVPPQPQPSAQQQDAQAIHDDARRAALRDRLRKAEDRAPAPPPTKPAPPAVPQEQHLATTTPVVDAFVDEAAAKGLQWSADDHKSPLEEELDHPASAPTPASGQGYDAKIDTLVQSLPFSIAKDLHGRFRSLILSRVKDVRTDAQIKDLATRPVGEGGLGLSEQQASELVSRTHTTFGLRHDPVAQTKQRKQRLRQRPRAARRSTERPRDASSLVAAAVEATTHQVPQPQGKKQAAGRPVMHDVTAPPAPPTPEPTPAPTMGPIDELRAFSLLDFRRLATAPAKAGEILAKKIQHLREESYLLYREGRDAWFASPLSQLYLAAARDSINDGEPMSVVLSQPGTDQLTESEFQAIAVLNTQI